jgi:hypothetical protein
MPLRRMTGRERSEAANWQLAALLAFTAGAVDVTGYLGLRQFTSHMSGVTATLAGHGVTHSRRLQRRTNPIERLNNLVPRGNEVWRRIVFAVWGRLQRDVDLAFLRMILAGFDDEDFDLAVLLLPFALIELATLLVVKEAACTG